MRAKQTDPRPDLVLRDQDALPLARTAARARTLRSYFPVLSEVPAATTRPLIDSDGTKHMGPGAVKTRFAIAAFDNGENLLEALAELMERGLERQQIGIVARASVLVNLERNVELGRPNYTGAASIIADVESTSARIDDDVILVTRNSFWQSVSSFLFQASNGLVAAHWMTPQLRDDLAGYIRNGAIILGVSADTLDQQRQSTRVLLEHSSHRVQTHEFTH